MGQTPPKAPDHASRASGDDPQHPPESRDQSRSGDGADGDGEARPTGGEHEDPGGTGSGGVGGLWRNPAARFVFMFLVYLGALAYFYPKARERYTWIMDALAEGTAAVEYYFFWPFASHVTLNEKVVVFNGFAVQIIEECTGVYEMLIYAAAVLAFPTTLAKKGLGLLFGCPLLYLCNVVRIAMLMAVGRYYPSAFEFMHLYLWQATLILFIVSVWMLWIYKVVRHDGEM
jgi:archaeosortase B (VPXXXP-CTERM-specific)